MNPPRPLYNLRRTLGWIGRSPWLQSHPPIHWGRLLGWMIPLVLSGSPSSAAERISLSYGLLERSISIETLETFASSTTIPSELRPYTRYFTADQIEQFRTLLSTQFELSPVAISQFLYTDQGEQLLYQLGEVVRTEARLSGSRALRASLVLAAFDPDDGLTPLTMLRYFPLDGIRIDLAQTSRILSQIDRQINQTQTAIALIAADADRAIATTPAVDFSNLPDLRQRGDFRVQMQSYELQDTARDRTFAYDLYLPRHADLIPLTTPAPIVVISHGLGSNRGTFSYLALHLASYGFVVAVPEHAGSNTTQLEALIAGQADKVTEPDEFINRPLDISRLLDELEQLANQDPALAGQFDTNNVGVLGQSLGGYTAFALAGVPLNRSQLDSDCANANPVSVSLNVSLLLQCDVLNLPLSKQLNFQDDRVRAIFTINSVGSSLLDRQAFSELDLPVMTVSSGADTVTPALPEQIEPFARLMAPHRYLLMMQNATHFSAIDIPPGESVTISLPPTVVGPNPAIAHRYLSAFSLAFFGKYLMADDTLDLYLSSGYARHLSQPDLPIDLVHNFPFSYLAGLGK